MEIKKSIYLSLLLLILVSNAIVLKAQDKTNNSNIELDDALAMEVKIVQNENERTDSIQLILTIKNIADYPIELFDPTLDRGLEIEVKDSNGKNTSLTKIGKSKKNPNIIMGRQSIYLEPGKEVNLKTDLTELFEINQENSYSVSVSVRPYNISSPQKKNQTSSKSISSNIAEFKLKKKEEK